MTSSIKVSIIVARARNGVIGVDGDLPWRLRDDLAFFKQTTKGHPIIMGRKTWLSLPRRPLPARDNLVLTRDHTFLAPGARVCTSVKAAIAMAKAIAGQSGRQEIFIIGGAMIYQEVMPLADKLYLTEVETNIDGDVSFPDFDNGEFEELQRLNHKADEHNQYDFTIRVLERRVRA
ncbi:dihydrofolate reductase [Hyphomonas sp. FCG-A18]|uniref:dihydrofolate reductase n=1 Tax=Hyphomonas sp. FCG-A18 TaxID=3080019 RepID=UPI002B281C28|nr:dihydrofolate reductase [Hyphomonas sp. FCG-A18]